MCIFVFLATLRYFRLLAAELSEKNVLVALTGVLVNELDARSPIGCRSLV